MIEALVLEPFRQDQEILITTNASPHSVGAVVFNRVEGKLQTIACTSATLSAAERVYPQYEREALAVVLSLKKSITILFMGRTLQS